MRGLRHRTPHDRSARALVLASALVLAAAGCTKTSPSQEVADRFMDLYYVRMNVAEAVKLCSGAARTRLDGELQAIKGVPPDAPGGEPRVTFSLTGSAAPSASQATYTYRVVAHTPDAGKLGATLTLANQDGRWLVTSLGEVEGAPGS